MKIILFILAVFFLILISGCIEEIGNPEIQCKSDDDCEKWARDNNIPVKSCIGNWVCEENKCDYLCLPQYEGLT